MLDKMRPLVKGAKQDSKPTKGRGGRGKGDTPANSNGKEKTEA